MCPDYLTFSTSELNNNAPLFIPVGSVEVHGPALPFGTDTFIAMAFAEKFARKVEGVTFPPIIFGICPNTQRFKKTISVTHEGFIGYLFDICSSLIARGFKKIVIVNIHNGNDAALTVFVEKVFDEYGVPVYYINPYTFMRDELDPKLFHGKDNSYKETSLLRASLKILGIEESEIHVNNADKDTEVTRPEELNILRKYGYVGFSYSEEAQHVGVRKDVDMEKGLTYIQSAAEKIPELMEKFHIHFVRCNKLNDMD